MIDIRLVRQDPEHIKAQLARKKVDPADVDRLVELDARQRELMQQRDQLRAQVKSLSQEVGKAKRDRDDAKAEELAARSRDAGAQEAKLAAETDELAAATRDLLLRIPNVPAPEALDGDSEDDNREVRRHGPDPDSWPEHQRVPHWEIGEQLGILDMERGAKISGSMFALFRKGGATLNRALAQYGLDLNADAFEEIRPPSLVLSDTLTATGQLPKFADDAYHVERDDLWAIPTAEVPLTSIARNEILDDAQLPMRLMAYTPCYRRESGSAGRDTRGLLRTHEFDKVEILAYCRPEDGPTVHEELIARAERPLQELGLTYRVLEICTGDLGQSHARQFDLEVWSPGAQRWLEVSSISWFTDYQARRANIRYRPAGSKETAFVHTLNGSGLAVPRVWAVVVETNRQPDGTVAVPEPLLPYFRGATTV